MIIASRRCPLFTYNTVHNRCEVRAGASFPGADMAYRPGGVQLCGAKSTNFRHIYFPTKMFPRRRKRDGPVGCELQGCQGTPRFS